MNNFNRDVKIRKNREIKFLFDFLFKTNNTDVLLSFKGKTI